MFLGRHAHAIDGKGRLAIPARFREGLAGGVVVTRGIDRCLSLYPLAAWEPLAAKVAALPTGDPDARDFRRIVFSEAADLVPDAQGRILLPPELRRFAGLEKEALIVGVHSHVEVWSPAAWEALQTRLDADGDAIARRLADLI